MGRWTREELELAFDHYQRLALRAGTTGDWDAWADQFTEDATYVEHLFGTFGGREAIRRWIKATMATYPNSEMKYFPIDWYVIDEERGWIVAKVWNRMADPGDGSLHQEYNFTLLKYAGDMQWSYEEDVYNPASFGTMVQGWLATKARLDAARSTARPARTRPPSRARTRPPRRRR
jgi:SnoaL-like domain